jgi:hypothetical protein
MENGRYVKCTVTLKGIHPVAKKFFLRNQRAQRALPLAFSPLRVRKLK